MAEHGKARTKSVKSWLWDWSIDHWPQIGVALSGSIMAAIALVSDWLRAYGPAAWVAAFALGVLIASEIYRIIAMGRDALANSRLRTMLASTPPLTVNPLRSTFDSERVRVSDFYSPYHVMHKGKSFKDCEIVGPGAMVVLDHCSLNNCGFVECDLVSVKKAMLKTAAGFQATAFNDCRFYNVTIFIPESLAKHFLATMLDGKTGEVLQVIGINA